MAIIMRGGIRTGMDHRRKDTNRQDAYHIQGYGNITVGTVSDGCGSGDHSETGSLRAVQYFTQSVLSRIKNDYQVVREEWVEPDNSEWIVKVLEQCYDQYLDFLQEQIDVQFKWIDPEISDPLKFADNHLLHTLLSLICITDNRGKHHAWSILMGDGYIIQDDEVEMVENITETKKGNATIYPALALSPYKKMDGLIRFAARNDYWIGSFGTSWDRLAISSDGLRVLTSDQILAISFATEDNDKWAIQQNIDFAVSDGELENDDDVSIVSVEKVNEA